MGSKSRETLRLRLVKHLWKKDALCTEHSLKTQAKKASENSEQRGRGGLNPWSCVVFFLLQYEMRGPGGCGHPCMEVGTVTPLVCDGHLWLSLGAEPRNPVYLSLFHFYGNLGNMEADFLFTTRKHSFKGIKATLSWKDGVSKWRIEIYYASGT